LTYVLLLRGLVGLRGRWQVNSSVLQLDWRYVRFDAAYIDVQFACAQLEFDDAVVKNSNNGVWPCPIWRKLSVAAQEVLLV